MTSHRQHGAGCQPSTPAPPLHTKTTSSPISARGAQERPLSPKPKVEPAPKTAMDPALVQALRDAKALCDDGVLTMDEYQAKKQELLKPAA